MESILISACLLGYNTKYDGGNNYVEELYKLKEKYNLIPFCPEEMGGLSTPRVPSEVSSGRVFDKNGFDVTENFVLGAKKALEMAQLNEVKIIIMKEKSPSCGVQMIYDGTFTRKLIPGKGITAALFADKGYQLYNEKNFIELLK